MERPTVAKRPAADMEAGGVPRMRVLVTGGSGYVGRFLIPALKKDGHEVISVSRSSSPVALDVSKADECKKVLHEVKPDVVVHLAALSAPAKCEEDPKAARLANVPIDFAKAAKEANPAVRFVFLSTDQVLDGKGHLVDEAFEARPINVYGQTKLEMEAAVKELFPQWTILRLSFVYGPQVEGAHSTFLQFALEKLRAGSEFSVFSDQIRSCIFIDDVVEVLRLAAQGKVSGLVNLGGPEPLSRHAFCTIVARHVGLSTEMVKGNTYCLPTPSPSDISMHIGRLEGMLERRPLTLASALDTMSVKL